MLDVVRDWNVPLGFERDELCASDGTLIRMVVAGPPSARPVILLHGAPQFSYCWREVIQKLADRYRVFAPDLRGYGASELAKTGRYDIDTLVEDLQAVIGRAQASGPRADDRVLLGAHDWGGAIAWVYAERHPESLRHLVIANAPHPAAFVSELSNPGQAIRSWYIAFFQTPGVERILEATHGSFFLWMMRSSSANGTFSDEALAAYRAALDRPGRAEAVLEYYRQAMAARGRVEIGKNRVEVPATIVWGEADKALAPSQPDATRRYASRVEIRRLPGTSHWVPEERPEEIVRALVDGDEAG